MWRAQNLSVTFILLRYTWRRRNLVRWRRPRSAPWRRSWASPTSRSTASPGTSSWSSSGLVKARGHRVKYGVRSPKVIWAPVYSCTHWLRTSQPSPSPHVWAHILRAILVRQDRRHLFATPTRELGQRHTCVESPGTWRWSSSPLSLRGADQGQGA